MRAARTVARAALILGIVTVPGLIFSVQLYALYRLEGRRIRRRASFILQLSHWYLWALAGPAVWALTRRWPVVGPERGRHVGYHCAAAILTGALVTRRV